MTIELERILTISAEEYCKIYGKKLTDYTVRGIHITSCEGEGDIKKFAKMVPDEAEVIVNFHQAYGGTYPRWNGYYASGTALIPKNKSSGGR